MAATSLENFFAFHGKKCSTYSVKLLYV